MDSINNATNFNINPDYKGINFNLLNKSIPATSMTNINPDYEGINFDLIDPDINPITENFGRSTWTGKAFKMTKYSVEQADKENVVSEVLRNIAGGRRRSGIPYFSTPALTKTIGVGIRTLGDILQQKRILPNAPKTSAFETFLNNWQTNFTPTDPNRSEGLFETGETGYNIRKLLDELGQNETWQRLQTVNPMNYITNPLALGKTFQAFTGKNPYQSVEDLIKPVTNYVEPAVSLAKDVVGTAGEIALENITDPRQILIDLLPVPLVAKGADALTKRFPEKLSTFKPIVEKSYEDIIRNLKKSPTMKGYGEWLSPTVKQGMETGTESVFKAGAKQGAKPNIEDYTTKDNIIPKDVFNEEPIPNVKEAVDDDFINMLRKQRIEDIKLGKTKGTTVKGKNIKTVDPDKQKVFDDMNKVETQYATQPQPYVSKPIDLEKAVESKEFDAIVINGQTGYGIFKGDKNKAMEAGIYKAIKGAVGKDKATEIFNKTLNELKLDSNFGSKPIVKRFGDTDLIFMPKLNKIELESQRGLKKLGNHVFDIEEARNYINSFKEVVDNNKYNKVAFHPFWNKDTYNRKTMPHLVNDILGDQIGSKYTSIYSEHKPIAKFGQSAKSARKLERKAMAEAESLRRVEQLQQKVESEGINIKTEAPEIISPEAISEAVDVDKTLGGIKPLPKEMPSIEKSVESPVTKSKIETIPNILERANKPTGEALIAEYTNKNASKEVKKAKEYFEYNYSVKQKDNEFLVYDKNNPQPIGTFNDLEKANSFAKQRKWLDDNKIKNEISKRIKTEIKKEVPPTAFTSKRKKGGSQILSEKMFKEEAPLTTTKKVTEAEMPVKLETPIEEIKPIKPLFTVKLKKSASGKQKYIVVNEKGQQVSYHNTLKEAEFNANLQAQAQALPSLKESKSKIETPKIEHIESIPKKKIPAFTTTKKVTKAIKQVSLEEATKNMSNKQAKAVNYMIDNSKDLKLKKGDAIGQLNTVRTFTNTNGTKFSYRLGDEVVSKSGKKYTILFDDGDKMHLKSDLGILVKAKPEDIDYILPHNTDFHAGIPMGDFVSKKWDQMTDWARKWFGIGEEGRDIIQKAKTYASNTESAFNRSLIFSPDFFKKKLNIPEDKILEFNDFIHDYITGRKTSDEFLQVIKHENAKDIKNLIDTNIRHLENIGNEIYKLNSEDEILQQIVQFKNPYVTNTETIPSLVAEASRKGKTYLMDVENFLTKQLDNNYVKNNQEMKLSIQNGLDMIKSMQDVQAKNLQIHKIRNEFLEISQNPQLAKNSLLEMPRGKRLVGKIWGDLEKKYVSPEIYLRLQQKKDTLKYLLNEVKDIEGRNVLQLRSIKKVSKYLQEIEEEGGIKLDSKAMRTMGFLVDPMKEYYQLSFEAQQRLAVLRIHKALLESNNLVLPSKIMQDGKMIPNPNIPKKYQLLSGNKYGKLDGYYAEPSIATQLMEVEKTTDRNKGWFRTLNRYWKTGVTVLNPKTHLNNVMGNFILADINDSLGATGLVTNHTAWKRHWGNAWNTLFADDPTSKFFKAKQIAIDAGALQGSLIKEELGISMRPEMKDVLKEFSEGKIKKAMASGIELLSQYYTDEDNIFKVCLFWKKMEDMELPLDKVVKMDNKQLSEIMDQAYEAGKYARDIIPSYDLMPKWIKSLREAPLIGSPFVSFNYSYLTRSLPRTLGIKETIKAGTPAWKKQLKLLAYLMAPPTVGWLIMNRDKISSENEEAGIASYDRSTIADIALKFKTLDLASKTLHIPKSKLYSIVAEATRGKIYVGKDSQGRRMYFDYSKIMPLIDVQYQLNPFDSKFLLFKEPMYRWAVEMAWNKDMQGRTIIPEGASDLEKTKLRLLHLWNSFLPPVITPKNYKSLLQFYNKQTDELGNLKMPLDNLLWKTMTGWMDFQSPEINKKYKIKEYKREIQNLKEYIKKEKIKLNRHEITKKEFDEKYKDFLQQIKDTQEYYQIRGVK